MSEMVIYDEAVTINNRFNGGVPKKYKMRGIISGSFVIWDVTDQADPTGIYSNYDPPPTNIKILRIH